jgi:hypothetical protein
LTYNNNSAIIFYHNRKGGIKLKIFENGLRKAYLIHKTDTKYYLCRILNEYNSEEEANNDKYKLLSDKITEKQLLKEYSKKLL